jgi:alpha-beta hydrolase superfamily lysophospholipase
MQQRTLDVRTAEGHTLKVGVCAAECTGPSILILPGLYSHMGWYRPLGEALAARGASVFLMDRRGAGQSEGIPGHMSSWRQLIDDILRVVARIKELHPSASVCALGVSLGSAMGLATSLVTGDCFRRQAALSPGLASAIQVSLLRRVGLACSGLARPRALYRIPYTMEQLSDREEIRQALWNDPLRTRAFTARFLLEVFRMQRFVRRNLVHLRAPLLAMVAEEDAMVDNRVVVQALQRVQRTPVRVEVFEGAHHVLPASVPLEDLVGRIDHWFTAPDAALDQSVVIRRIPPAGDAAGTGPAGCRERSPR